MASLSTCHLGLWLGWQILLNLVIIQVLTNNMKMPSFHENRPYINDLDDNITSNILKFADDTSV